ncbi:MAG: hypothetical protein R3C19_18390 [Planctomycetaceae bacterium]
MKKLSFALLLVSLLAFVPGCGSEDTKDSVAGAAAPAPAGDSAEATASFVMAELKAGRPVVLWNSLPEKYQNDANEIVRTFAQKMDPQIWTQIHGMLASVNTLLHDKQEFIMNHPGVANSPNGESAKAAIPATADLLQALLDSAGDLEKLKTFDGGEFLGGPGTKISHGVAGLLAAMPADASAAGQVNPALLMQDVKIETVSESGDSAVLKLTTSDGKSSEETFTRVDGKWLPAEMVARWDENMKNTRESLAQLPESINQIRMPVMVVSGVLPGMLAQLQSAETQEEFNAAVESLQGQAMGIMMQSMGGGGPGAFGGPPAVDADYSPDPEVPAVDPPSPGPPQEQEN